MKTVSFKTFYGPMLLKYVASTPSNRAEKSPNFPLRTQEVESEEQAVEFLSTLPKGYGYAYLYTDLDIGWYHIKHATVSKAWARWEYSGDEWKSCSTKGQQFREDCRFIARELGEPLFYPRGMCMGVDVEEKKASLVKYEDRFLYIEADMETEALHIARRKIPESPEEGLSKGTNPMVMVKSNGECYRSHGEQGIFHEYVQGLVKMLYNAGLGNRVKKENP